MLAVSEAMKAAEAASQAAIEASHHALRKEALMMLQATFPEAILQSYHEIKANKKSEIKQNQSELIAELQSAKIQTMNGLKGQVQDAARDQFDNLLTTSHYVEGADQI